MAQTIRAYLKKNQIASVSHPGGFCLNAFRQSFDDDADVEVTDDGKSFFPGCGQSFQVNSTAASKTKVKVTLYLRPEDIGDRERQGKFFVEIQEGNTITILTSKLKEVAERGENKLRLDANFMLPANKKVTINSGMFPPLSLLRRFHPTPQQFKIGPLDFYSKRPEDHYSDGSCRRRGTTYSISEECCGDPKPQDLYPACYPAAWARLFSAYQLILTQPRRKWEVGTPVNPNPDPGEYGDSFSTWAMGSRPIGAMPTALKLDDWEGGEEVELVTLHFPLDETLGVEEAVRERAEDIKNSLKCIVGGLPLAFLARPVFICHSGHAWNVVGVANSGYWSHGQNPNSADLSDWTEWERADWLEAELALVGAGKPPHPEFIIYYPKNCELKPEKARVGSITMWGSGGNANNIQFVDLPIRQTIDWTPHITGSAGGCGYIWLEDETALANDGLPVAVDPALWDDDLGLRIPLPEKRFGHCTCHWKDGCGKCRLRLMLPFWVHNTTLDETLNYKVDLYFWSGYHRWVRIDAKLTAPNSDGSFRGFPPNYPTYYNPDNPFGISPFTPHLSLPGPGSGVPFVIQATPDVTPQAAGRGHPFNWQPIAWHVDLTLDQLVPGQIHGIKLVLTCLDTCEVQDIKQLWFRMQEVPVY